ncbi:MAG: hypothetical protein COA50_02890 [Flavobacteriaceae bacterium]|nr:MAG: hypothetical protein COA50_02890 [Flavobacteriaceae bacterium]
MKIPHQMRRILNALIISMFIVSCSSSNQLIKLEIRENQLFIQNKKTVIDAFETDVRRLTKGFTEEELRKVTFSLTMDGKSKIGLVSDLKVKMENWKESQKNK